MRPVIHRTFTITITETWTIVWPDVRNTEHENTAAGPPQSAPIVTESAAPHGSDEPDDTAPENAPTALDSRVVKQPKRRSTRKLNRKSSSKQQDMLEE